LRIIDFEDFMNIIIKKPYEISNINEYIDTWKTIRNELIQSLEDIPNDIFTKKPEVGWSASEIAEHLYLTQYLFAIFIPKVLSGSKGYSKEELKPIPYDDLYETLSKPFSGVKNPDAVTPKNHWDKATCIENLNKSMNLMINNLSHQDLELLKNRGMMHGIFGPISILDFTYNLIVHELGHLRAVKEKYKI